MSFAQTKKNKRVSQFLMLVGFVGLVLAIFAVAIPNLLRSRIAANEASAVGSIRTINTALVTYHEQHPEAGFPKQLSEIAPQIDSVLATGQKSGYRFRYVPQAADFGGAVQSFRVEAVPMSHETGRRRFSSDETGEVHYQASLEQPEQLLDGGLTQQPQTAGAQKSPRMLRKASLNLVVAEPVAVGEKIRVLAYRLGGYVDSVRFSDEGAGTRQTSIEIRVPADRFEEARREVRALGERVKNEEDDARDVSAQHTDLESQLRNYRAEEAQYLEIMRRSGTIKDTLAVSEHLSDVRGRIERTQGQLDQLAHQTEMALLEVRLGTEAAAQALEVRWRPMTEIKAAFWSAADDLSTYAKFMIAVFFRLPVFALWALTILTTCFGGWRLLRWTWKRFATSPVAAA